MKHKSNSILLSVLLCVLFPLHAQSNSNNPDNAISDFFPSHEGLILFVDDHEGKLYSLDQNALLIIQDTNVALTQRKTVAGKEQYINISKTRLSRASLHYPYIISNTIDNVIEIYDIIQQIILVRTHTDGNIIRLSQDRKLLIYTVASKILLWDINTQSLLQSISYPQNAIPIHIEIASSNENIMIYYDDGSIQYRQSSTGRILKEITESPVLNSLALTKSRKYAVGFNNSNLMSVNLLDGRIISNLIYPARINKIVYFQELDCFLVVTLQQNNTENVQSYKVLEDGRLEQNDILQLSGLQNISYMSYVNKYFLFGESTGDILSFDSVTNKFSLDYTNKTSVVFDAFLVDEYLFLAQSDGIIHFPFSQLLEGPANNSTVKTATMDGSLSLLEYSNPLFYPIESLLKASPTGESLGESTGESEEENSYKSNQTKFIVVSQEEIYPLLYTISKDRILDTQNLLFIPSIIVTGKKNQIFYYSEQHSTLVSSIQNNSNSFTFLGSKLIFSIQKTTEQNTIWLNEALHKEAEFLIDSAYTRLWKYDSSIINKQTKPKSQDLAQEPIIFENEKHLDRIDLPFNEDDIVYFEVLDSSIDMFYIIVDENNSQSELDEQSASLQIPIRYSKRKQVYLLSDNTEQDSEDFFPLAITKLGTIEDQNIVEIATFGEQQETLLIFTSQNIQRFNINTETMELQLKSSFLYPKDLGVPLKIRVFKNYILYVDRNNVVSILQIESDKIVKISSMLLSENKATVIYF